MNRVRRVMLAILAAGALLLPIASILRPADVVALDLPPSQPGVSVYDFAHIWSESTISTAEGMVATIRERTQAEIAVVSWPTGFSSVDLATAGADARTIMDTWGVGRAGVNDGLVVLFDMDTTLRHGQIYLFAGQGFERLYLDPSELQPIVKDDMLPPAKQGYFDGALLAGLTKVDRAVQPGGNPARAVELALHLLIAALIIGLALVVFGWFLRTWWLRGRDARLPLIDDSVLLPGPPPRLTPALATVLRKDEVDKDSFTSALVDLGHRGLLMFRQSSGVLGIGKHVDLVVRGKPLDDGASRDARERQLGTPEESLLVSISTVARFGSALRGMAAMAGLFGSATGVSQPDPNDDRVLTAARLKQGEGRKLFDAFRKDMGQAAKASGWFRDDPNQVTRRWRGIGFGLAVVAVAIGVVAVLDQSDSGTLVQPGREFMVIPLVVAIALGAAIAVMAAFLAARTPDGAQTLAMALAYRNTLKFELAAADSIDSAAKATTSRLPWIRTPDELTVWAVALGLQQEVDRVIARTIQFHSGTGTGLWAPLWFSSSGGFGSGGLSSMGDFSGMIGSIATTSSSASGGGFGGGGGGGGGGAGGGF